MRQTFRGFYSDENRIEEVLKSDDTRIILDTNVLLNLYNYHDEIREKFFETLKELESNLWLPYHVVLEYQRRRVAVLRREKNKFHVLKGTADSCLETLGKVKNQALFKRIPEVKTITEEYREKLKPILEEYKDKIEELNKSQLAAPKNDPIRGVITELFDGRVGSAPSEEWLNELVAEGEKRFEAKVPPGYRDEKKDLAEQAEFHYAGINYQNKLGDLIIWKQVIEMANAANDQVKNIVFVTDDGKEDWWHLDQSSKKEKIGARAELREELCRDGEVKHFSMYDSADFLELASKAVNVTVDQESISDVRSRVIDSKFFQDGYLVANGKGYFSYHDMDGNQQLLSEEESHRNYVKMVVNAPPVFSGLDARVDLVMGLIEIEEALSKCSTEISKTNCEDAAKEHVRYSFACGDFERKGFESVIKDVVELIEVLAV